MYVILCEGLRMKYDSLLWNERKGNTIFSNDFLTEMIEEIDYMQGKYHFSTEIKLLIFDLAEKGKTVNDSEARIDIILEVLDEEGYQYETNEISI